MASLTQIMAKLKPGAAPSKTQNVQSILAKLKPGTPQAPTVSLADTPPQQSFASRMFGAAKNFAGGAEQALAQPVVDTASTIQKGLQETVGRGVSAIEGKGFTPSGGASTLDPNTPQGQAVQNKINAPTGIAGDIGKAVGTVAPYLTGAGEEEGVAAGASIASRVAEALGKESTDFIPKVAGIAAKLGVKTAAQTPIATAQTGSLKSGIEQSAAFSGGEEVLGAVTKGAKSLFKTGEQKLVDALTPYLTPSKIEKGITASAQKGEEFSASEMSTVKKSVQAVKDVAAALGKNVTSIIKSGAKVASGNAARLGKAIRDYSQKVVSPMLKNNPVPFSFADLRGAFANVMPKDVLKDPEATAAFKRIGESFLNVIGKSIKGTGRYLSEDDFNDIWNARKVMDNIITDERGANAFGTQARTGIDAAAKAYRGAFKQFLSDSYRYAGQMDKLNTFHANVATLEQKFGRDLGEDELTALQKQMGIVVDEGKKELADQWDKHMSNMSSLYDAIGNVATRAKKEYGKSWADLYGKAHPIQAGIAKEGAKIAGTGAIGAGIYEGIQHFFGSPAQGE